MSSSSSTIAAPEGVSPARPRNVIRPGSTSASLDFRQLWLYRDLLLALSSREIKLRYRQTALGAIWVVLQPLLGASILTFVFTRIASVKSPAGVPPFMISYAGFLLWNVFNSTVSKASAVLVGNSSLISKVYFPRLCLPLSVILPVLVDLAIAVALLAVLMVATHLVPNITVLLWPLFLLITVVLSLGLSLITSSLMVTYRDVQYVVPVVLNFLLYLSPVAYAASANMAKLPPFVQSVYNLNPMVSLLEGSRYALYGTGNLSASGLLYSAVFAVVVFAIGMTCFRKMERKFADVI